MTDDEHTLHPETIAIRAGRAGNGRALAPVAWTSTVFTSPDAASAADAARSTRPGGFYTRHGNPTIDDFEDAIAALEGAERARAFGSGMGAISAIVLGLCSTGDHIVATKQLYSLTTLLLTTVCPRLGIEVTFVDGTDAAAIEAAVRPGTTQLVIAETPANPNLDLVDLDALGALRGPITVVDSTFATPLLQRPLEHGVDLVVHAATKGLAGHNDATLGVVAGSEELIAWLWGFAILQGANASPYDAMNGIRGLRTLPVRLERQCESALFVAAALEGHDAVASVRYPWLPSHPQHDLARRQMHAGGSLVTIELAGGADAGRAFVEGVEIAQLATSLGGPETLVTHPASTTHAGLTPEELADAGITQGTVRISIGLEHRDDILVDLERALRRAPR
jgi:cystathionine beta-lyase/cystathionine gamma-synthase